MKPLLAPEFSRNNRSRWYTWCTVKDQISRAADQLKMGDVVALPTETVYGLAGSIRSEAALQKIFRIKARPLFDPLIVHISELSQLDEVVGEWPKLAQILAEKFWPGPLTVVVKKNPRLNPLITASLDSVGVRMPAHPIARALIAEVQIPLAAPSANRFGKTSPTKAADVRAEFPSENLNILDGGDCEVGLESTVVKIINDSSVQVLRPGFITPKDLRAALGNEIQILEKISHESPGHLQMHYQPSKPLILVEQGFETSEIKPRVEKFLNRQNLVLQTLELDPNPILCARRLYGELRRLSEEKNDAILVFKPTKNPSHMETPLEIWDAIWNRLERAASLKLLR